MCLGYVFNVIRIKLQNLFHSLKSNKMDPKSEKDLIYMHSNLGLNEIQKCETSVNMYMTNMKMVVEFLNWQSFFLMNQS
jgi:hypothetical protein